VDLEANQEEISGVTLGVTSVETLNKEKEENKEYTEDVVDLEVAKEAKMMRKDNSLEEIMVVKEALEELSVVGKEAVAAEMLSAIILMKMRTYFNSRKDYREAGVVSQVPTLEDTITKGIDLVVCF
jgi:hypothetical protein